MVETPKHIDVLVTARDRLQDMFNLQRELQTNTYGKDPGTLEGEERVQFIKDMNLALQDELHEVLGEVGWKPWATSRHVNEGEAKGEMVDAWHFFMNLCLVLHLTPEELHIRYLEKRGRNIKRQTDGYDGVQGKCSVCHRAFDDLAKAWGLPIERVHQVQIGVLSDGESRVNQVIGDFCRECAGDTVIDDD